MRIIITFLITAFIFSCKQNPEKHNELSSEKNQEVQENTVNTTPENERFETLEVVEFNQVLTNTGQDLSAQEIMRLYYPQEVESNEGKEEISIQEEILENGNALVTLIHDNLMDDSVKGEKYVMELKKTDNKWLVLSIKKNWKCWEGRGHTDWDTEFCL